VLIACEFSGIIREAFRQAGHHAISCDFKPTEIAGPHYQGDVRDLLYDGWDLMIAHPPCNALCVSGARWMKEKKKKIEESLDFVSRLMCSPIPRICIENPKGILSTKMRKPDQIIHPWQFGHQEKKGTCLWLKNLPLLKPTCIIPEKQRHWQYVTGTNRQKAIQRSKTFKGIGKAMSEQWSKPMEILVQ